MTIPAVHPGELLAELVADERISAGILAIMLRIPEADIQAVIDCQKPMTPGLADALAARCLMPARLWMNLQANWDAAQRRRRRS